MPPAATALQYPVRTPEFRVAYAGANITAAISNMVLGVTYTDEAMNRAGDLEIKLEDKDKRWQGKWYPQQGDMIELVIGYAGEPKLNCGVFILDDLTLEGPPDVFTIRAVATSIDPSFRTPSSFTYENTTLLQLAQQICTKRGLTLQGAPADIDVSFMHVTQAHETDLAFLRRLANENDYNFTIRGTVMQFYSRTYLQNVPPVFNIDRTMCEKFHFKSFAYAIYKESVVSYQDPHTGMLITGSATALPTILPGVKPGDTLKVVHRVESAADATQKANAALRTHNMVSAEATLTLPGTITMVALNNITVSGFGTYSGKYQINKAIHKLTRDQGYTTEVELIEIPY